MNNLQLRLDCCEITAPVDTAADYSVLGEEFVQPLRKVRKNCDGTELLTTGAHLITPLGRCTGRMDIAGHRFTVKLLVLPICSRNDIV